VSVPAIVTSLVKASMPCAWGGGFVDWSCMASWYAWAAALILEEGCSFRVSGVIIS
jgi:hypothetical protein